MKLHIPCCLLVAGMLMAGCTLDEVLEFGEPCPPRDVDAKLSYIGTPYCSIDQTDKCDVKNVQEYFRVETCPRLYSVCAPNPLGDGYHCESENKIVTQCAFNEIKCPVEGADEKNGFTCLNPADAKTCGAKSCEDEGINCSVIDSRAICLYNRDKGNYYCGCPDGDIFCDDKCVTPETSGTHCGARGACSSSDLASDDYKGENCEAGFTFCREGKCTCSEGKVWCSLNGKFGCYDPRDEASCNVHVMEDGVTCEAYACKSGESCELLSADTYECQLSRCGNGQQICTNDADKKECVSLLDTRFCGSCRNNCNDYPFEYAHAKSCERNLRDIPTCHFACDEGYTNCGTETAPKCITLDTISDCGACGNACKSKEICENGECITTTCADKQCTVPLEGDKVSCVSTDTQCGVDCADCTKRHPNGFCKDGACVISVCGSDEHPIYSGNNIIQCEKNSSKACASKDLQPGQPVIDCTTTLPAATSVACTSEGKCVITECPGGQHLAGDRRSCVNNTPSACGAANSTQTVNCASQIGNASNLKCQNDGSCSVVTCSGGFHIAPDGRSCVANTNEACGSTNSSNTTNCTHTIQKVCSNGSCACSSDGSTVLNYNQNACVIKECGGIPGVLVGTVLTKNWYSGANNVQRGCNPTQCVAGYKQMSQSGNNVYFSCRPPGASSDACNPFGYKYWRSGYCAGIDPNSGKNGHNHCLNTDYREYITACLHKDVCCGTRNLTMRTASDYLCDNCRAKGQTCNTDTGRCQ